MTSERPAEVRDQTRAPLPRAVAARLAQVEKLMQATEQVEVVQRNLQHLWSTGGQRDATSEGRRPELITLRFGFLTGVTQEAEPLQAPPLARLVEGRGLTLKLLLLMIFDAQCRHRPGQPVTTVHRVRPQADERYESWARLVLTAASPKIGSGSGPQKLRARQITDALRVLETKNLVANPAQRRSGEYTRFDRAQLLSEEGLSSRPSYHSSADWRRTFSVPRSFFTSLWVFALSDAEIANYLMFCALRTRFPNHHDTKGVFAVTELRESYSGFGLSSAVYRTHAMLHRFKLIDRLSEVGRDYATGAVRDFAKQWKNGVVEPHRFQVIDETLQLSALETIHQTISRPTTAETWRRIGFSPFE